MVRREDTKALIRIRRSKKDS